MRIVVSAVPPAAMSPNAPNILTWPTRVRKASVMVQVVIKGDPVSKQRPRLAITRKGNVYTPRQTSEAEDAIGWQIKAAYRGMLADPDHAFGVRLIFYQATQQRRDLDNMTKLVFDACNGIVWADDSQVVEMIGHVFRGEEDPRTEICIYILGHLTVPTRKCLACGKVFRIYPSWVDKRYCSSACQKLGKRSGQLRQCAQCGNTIYREPHKLGVRTFLCSTECKRLYQTAELICVQCSKVFHRAKSLIKPGRAFCSKECQATYWRNTRAKRGRGVCLDCGRATSKKTYIRCRSCYAYYVSQHGRSYQHPSK